MSNKNKQIKYDPTININMRLRRDSRRNTGARRPDGYSAFKNQSINRLPHPVFLQSDDHGKGKLHERVEHYLFFKTAEFKNNPRVNHMLARSVKTVFWLVLLVTLFCLVCLSVQWLLLNAWSNASLPKSIQWIVACASLSNLIKFALTFVGACSFLFWKQSELFRQQWQYCANLYNDAIKQTDPLKARTLRTSLAVDLVVVDLWAHRSFSEFFRNELWTALMFLNGSDERGLSDFVRRVQKHEVTEIEVRQILERYQAELIEESIFEER